MTKEITIMAWAKPKPEHYNVCKQALLDLRKATLKEPGCLQFEILESENNDGKIYFFERFKGQGSFDLHFTHRYTMKVFEAYKEWLAEELHVVNLKAAQ